tara:strand:+ start:9452 stop:9865 length:414 start_codon:yes stop_codon:yes gene_type:complete
MNSTKTLSLEPLNFIQGDKFEIEADNYYVLEFWAIWCPPCVKSIPHLNDLYKTYKDKVNFVGITSGDNSAIIKFINERKDSMTYPVANDIDNVLHDELEISGIPVLYIIGKDSNIIWSGHPLDDQVQIELEKIKNEK